jgi:hypothetical protein
VDAVIVVHFLSHAKEELASLKHIYHHSHVLLDLLERLLCVLRLVLVVSDLRLKHFYLILEGFLQVELAQVRKLPSLNYFLDLVLDLFVAFLQLIELGVEHVDVVLKTIVLFLCLYECGHDLLDVGDSGRLLDLIEGILNNFHIS